MKKGILQSNFITVMKKTNELEKKFESKTTFFLNYFIIYGNSLINVSLNAQNAENCFHE